MNQPSNPARRLGFLLAFSLLLAVRYASANPKGMTVVSGSAHSTTQGKTLQVTTSQTAILNWNSFNIATGETTLFKQPSSSSIVVNNILGGNASQIYGSLQANGIVILQNQSGFYFGPNAFVKAGGLVVTTAAVDPWAATGGAGWSFTGPPTAMPIVNYGHLETTGGGSLFLIANQIDNYGTISAPGGTAALLSGQQVLLSDRADGLGLSVPVTMPAGSVDNEGKITADAGQVLLQAQTVNNSGVIQANSVREKNGVIELYASDDLQLGSTSVIQANGDATGNSSGGDISIKSGGTFSDSIGSQISATGGSAGGNGGNIEVSAPYLLSLDSRIDASAQPGWSQGTFSLDPENIILGSFSSGSTPAGSDGVIDATGDSGTVDVDVASAFQNINASILLEASGNITLNPGTTWDLSATTGHITGQLTLEAGGNITLGTSGGAPAIISDANNWSVTLDAGYNFTAGQGVVAGVGNVTLRSGSAIETAAGNINVLAGNTVQVGAGGLVTGIANGAVMASGGGSINVQAVSGNVISGTSKSGYLFTSTGDGYVVNPALGGISTAAGGNVTIQAGGDITAALPSASDSVFSDYGTGAFGSAPGNVTLIAGGDVTGHFVLANGTGTINAVNAGDDNQDLALSLIKGTWTVNASDSILLQEVRNPNGMFNHSLSGGSPAPTQFLYNYDPNAAVTLNAGNNVTITGTTTSDGLPRVPGVNEGLIFPPSLTINAGAGGITLDSDLNLFPSPVGTLNLTTTGGGNLTGPASAATITLSDSQSTKWVNLTSFTSADQGDDALHLNDPNPVLIDISGSVSDILLYSSKAVDMLVSGNIVDSGAIIKNLHSTDTTTVAAGGEILDHSTYVILTLPTGVTPDFDALDSAQDPYLSSVTHQPSPVPVGNPIANPAFNATLLNVAFTYEASSHSLLFEGVMSSAVEAALESMSTPFLPAATISQIYSQSLQEGASPRFGFQVAGPGNFNISAATIDLGNGPGILSTGIDDEPALVPYTTHGANINLSVSGDLTMLASAIESEYGGAININTGGAIDVGSPLLPSVSNRGPLGIVSLYAGDISVIANGDVNVDGSRIAAYDGGSIFVESLTGNVNAGSGGKGYDLINKPYATASGAVLDLAEVIPGSGIIATSFPQLVPGETSSGLGNITVETPQGNILASQGGILQIALGPVAKNDATITLTAGSRNGDGTVAFAGDVDAGGSGVVGSQVNISATGSINGLVVATVGANLSAQQNVNATVLSEGSASVTAVSGTVGGTIVGAGTVSVSGGSGITALTLGGGGVTTSGNLSGSATPTGPASSNSGSAAATQQQVAQTTQSNSTGTDTTESDDEKKKRALLSKLKEYIGRVTVLLPQ